MLNPTEISQFRGIINQWLWRAPWCNANWHVVALHVGADRSNKRDRRVLMVTWAADLLNHPEFAAVLRAHLPAESKK
ncbi:MAG: hypothetical protein HC853_03415 [Anaerolineae bacterium]|nr:hypothetical protein [Anaerolineae bacterium]